MAGLKSQVSSIGLIVFSLILVSAGLNAMALSSSDETNQKAKFVEDYSVGLLVFENLSKSTNLDYLAVSLPLMLKDELKAMSEIFVVPEDILFETEEPEWERAWHQLKPIKIDTPLPSLTLEGEPVVTTNQKDLAHERKAEASLRKRLLFSSELAVRNDQTLDEVAKEYKWHFILFGKYRRLETGRVEVEVSLYNAIRGLVILNLSQEFDEEKILLELKTLGDQMKQSLINFPTAFVRVESEPSEALVYLDNKFVGHTPLDLFPVSATNHLLQLRKDGYGLRNFKISLESNQRYLFREELALERDQGVVEVKSDPLGADVLIDLVKVGKTPLVLTNLRAGLYRVTIDKDGFHSRHQQVEVKTGETSRVFLGLDRMIKGEPTLDERIEDLRFWMNLSFWSSAGGIVGYAWTYFNYEENLSEYYRFNRLNDQGGMARSLSSAQKWQTASNVFLATSVGCLALSGYFFVRYLILDDREMGRSTGILPDGLMVLPDQQVLMHWRF